MVTSLAVIDPKVVLPSLLGVLLSFWKAVKVAVLPLTFSVPAGEVGKFPKTLVQPV